MRGVITHVSYRKIITAYTTAYTTALNNIPETLGFAPYIPKIIDNCDQIFHSFLRFLTTSSQSSSDAIMIRPRYYNDVTKFSGQP